MAFKINNRRYTGSKYKITEWIMHSQTAQQN